MKSDFSSEGKVFGIEEWKLKMLWLPSVVVIAMILGWVMVLSPRFDEIFVFRRETVSMKKTVSEMTQKINYLSSADDDNLKRQEELVVQALPKNKNIYFMLTAVQGIAQKYNYVVDSFAVSPGEIGADSANDSKAATKKNEGGVLEKVPLKVVLLGPKGDHLGLIESLESSLPLLSIDKFKMTTTLADVRLELEVATYFSSDMLDVKIKNLTLADLTLTKEELATLETLGTFTKNDSVGNDLLQESGKAFVEYQRDNPFSL